jgi:AAA domain, putative AbiEii toxin, Type IV TA system
MTGEVLRLDNVGPIREAAVEFGDLTVLVGPQATGKSVFLQFLKLIVDPLPVFSTFKRYGLDWEKKWSDFFGLYFGEGMSRIWKPESSRVTWQGDDIDIARLVQPRKGKASEKCFFIPAQRVLALSRDGWLRPFADYKPGDPYTVRDFSEKLRVSMEAGLGRATEIFPQSGRLKAEIRRQLEDSVFSGFSLKVDKQGPQKRLVLAPPGNEPAGLPFMVWSAGQREFVPLLLGLYWVMPSRKIKRRGAIKWVVIEELEMGLHPKAISVMLLVVLDLLWRGYRVCLSTHSPHVLDLVWALRVFREKGASAQHVLELFEAKHTGPMMDIGRAALDKQTRVYYFDPKTRSARDISNLDPGSQSAEEAGWGGLTDFSGRVSEEVARVVAESDDI